VGCFLGLEKVEPKPSQEGPRPGPTRWNKRFEAGCCKFSLTKGSWTPSEEQRQPFKQTFCAAVVLPVSHFVSTPYSTTKNPTDTHSGEWEISTINHPKKLPPKREDPTPISTNKLSAYAKSGEWDSSRLNSPIAITPVRENQPPLQPESPKFQNHTKRRQTSRKKKGRSKHTDPRSRRRILPRKPASDQETGRSGFLGDFFPPGGIFVMGGFWFLGDSFGGGAAPLGLGQPIVPEPWAYFPTRQLDHLNIFFPQYTPNS